MVKENAMQPQSLKLTIKLKADKSAENPSTAIDHPSDNLVGEPNCFTEDLENHTTEDEQNPPEDNPYQLVLYDPNSANQSTPSSARPHPFSNQTPRVLPSVGAFTVQCAKCFKWRLIPTKEKYEEIREHILEIPFFCEAGREWRPDISCDDPPDLTPDGSRLWAIDKPSIAQAPRGWQRLLRIRGEGGSKFADVYYVAPSGKRLRSMVEIQRYLNEHPEYIKEGVSLAQFSFQTPKPLRENYVRKRPARAELTNDAADNLMPGSLLPSAVQPIRWVSPDVDTELQLSGPGLSGLEPETQSAKKKKKKKKTHSDQSFNGGLDYNQNDVNDEGSHQL